MVLKKNKWKNRWTLVLRTAIGYPYYKGSPCVTTEIITEKFDVLRGRLLGIANKNKGTTRSSEVPVSRDTNAKYSHEQKLQTTFGKRRFSIFTLWLHLPDFIAPAVNWWICLCSRRSAWKFSLSGTVDLLLKKKQNKFQIKLVFISLKFKNIPASKNLSSVPTDEHVNLIQVQFSTWQQKHKKASCSHCQKF